MKQWLIKWQEGLHQGSAIVQACSVNSAITAFMGNTKSVIDNSGSILSVEECPAAEVETLIAEIWDQITYKQGKNYILYNEIIFDDYLENP